MQPNSIQFKNGSTYERFMGKWSQLVGEEFLKWLNAKPGLSWIDVGCGNGAFTEMIVEQSASASVAGIDPSPDQITFARQRPALNGADFRQGDAMDLPFPDNCFDMAVMPLVIFFVPVPAKGVNEMARVVAPGGWVTAYSWDLPGGGFPYASLRDALLAMGAPIPWPPNPDASRVEVLRELWSGAGLEDIDIQCITVQRTFVDFDDYWATILGGPSMGPPLAQLSADAIATLQSQMRNTLPIEANGQITLSARANAVKGRVP